MSLGNCSKRLFDVSLVVLFAPLALPLGLAVALLVRHRLGTPVLFRQQRPGLGGRPFKMLKFRSMTDSRDPAGQLLPDAERLSAFGLWLRSTSLDELPGFINVLRGEMSLVGPRPLLMQYLPRYSAEQARRHQVKPGLTGFAQVRGRNAISWNEKLALDVWYVDHRTLCLDLRILAETVLKVLRRQNINASGQDGMPEFMGLQSTMPDADAATEISSPNSTPSG